MLRSFIAQFRRVGLQRRIMLYVTAGLLVFSGIYGLVALQTIQQSTRLVFQERLLIARALARQIDDTLADWEAEFHDTSTMLAPALAANDRAAMQNSLRVLYLRWSHFHSIANNARISLTDARGQILWSEPDPIFLPRTGSPLLDLSLERPSITNGIASDDAKHPILVLTFPIRAETQVIGFLVGEIERADMERLLMPALDVHEAGYVAELIDKTGTIIARNPTGKSTISNAHLELVTPLWQAGQAGVRTHLMAQGGHVIAFSPLTQAEWGIIVEQSVDEALTLPVNLQFQFALLGLGALVGGLVLAWLTTRTVVQPVKALIHAVQEIANGNLDHPLDVSGEAEVGTLARRFDEMRVRLKGSHEEIERWNRELEARVQQRTRELAALVESSQALTATLELDALFEILMRETHEVFPAAEGIALFLIEPETQILAVRSSFGLDVEASAQLQFHMGEAIAGKVFEMQKPALLKTAAQVQQAQADFTEANRNWFRRAESGRQVHSALGVPLTSKGARLGALLMYNFTRAAAFAESDVPLLQALANQAATAIENARLYKEASEVGTLRELNRVKSEFAVRASHELRTPLTSIKSLAETLLRTELGLDAKTQKEFLLGIDSATDRLAGIVNDLLMLTRIEAGQLTIQREAVFLESLIHKVVTQFEIQFPTYHFKLEMENPLPPVLGDPERLEDVLSNLFSNAVKYSAVGSLILVSAQSQPAPTNESSGATQVLISVADEGIGIPRHEREQVFERFYRVDNSVTRHVGGAGLGLYICRTYVEAMGGRIWVGNRAERGTLISFALPVASD